MCLLATDRCGVTGWHTRGFRIAGYSSQPGGLGVAVQVQVQGPWAACASEQYAALGVAVEALRPAAVEEPATPAARSAVFAAAS
jgi:hypothetical protein